MNSNVSVAVIGAGISGLTAAYRLKQAGLNPTVFEINDYVGGRIKSIQRGDFLFDVGAFIYLGSYTESVNLMKEVGLTDKLDKVKAYGAMPRDGTLHYLDLDKPLRSIVGTPYLSGKSKLIAIKMFVQLLKLWKDLNYEDVSGVSKVDSDTVASYSRRVLNQELLDYLTSIVVRGPWLSNPDIASVGQLFWTLKNFFKPYFYGLRTGMDALPRALAEHLDVRLKHKVRRVEDHGDHITVTYQSQDQEHIESFDACIITTTTDQALEIFPQMDPVQKQFFRNTQYITSVNTHIGLSRRPDNPATYILVSPREHRDLAGVIVDHKKASGRAPDHKGHLTVFCRHEWCVENLRTSDDEILAKILKFIEPYYGNLEKDVEDFEIGRWPRVVPIMPKGRFKDILTWQNSIDPSCRVQFAGDLAPIGGVNAALVSGERVAKRIAKRFGVTT